MQVALKNEASTEPLTKFLVKVRNNASFHYSEVTRGESLFGAFQQYFHKVPKTEVSSQLFASLGESPERSRFYFADAAAQSFIERATGERLPERAFELLKRVDHALRMLVGEYLKEKALAKTTGP